MNKKHIASSGIYEASKIENDLDRRIAYLKEIGYLDFLKEVGYTPLVFADGRLIFFPVSALPPGVKEGDKIEITIRRLQDAKTKTTLLAPDPGDGKG